MTAAPLVRLAEAGTRIVDFCAGPHRRLMIVIGFGWAILTSTAFALDSDGLGGLMFLVTAVVLITIVSLGPVLLGARPRRIWLVETLAGTLLLLSLLGQVVPWSIGPLRFVDVTYFAAYVALVLWLTLLSRHVGGGGDRSSILDSGAAAVGVALALWATVLAPLVGGSALPYGLVYAVYPTVDVALVALTVHLTLRLERSVHAAKWLLGSVILQLIIDTAHSLVRVVSPGTNTAPVFALFVFWLFGLAVAATDPSVVELAQRPAERRRAHQSVGAALVLVLAVSPAILSTAIPVAGTLDTVVRVVLVTLLLALLIARLWRTMAALSRAEADSHHRATHDDLTGLLNRAALVETLGDRLRLDARDGRCTAVVFFDCDDFKYVNDTWGHHAGDALLRDVARRLPGRLRHGDVLARQGGDEFVVVSSVRDVAEAVTLAEVVAGFFGEPLRILPGRVHAVTSSIGVAVAGPGRATTTEELLGEADLAMYEAKAQGRGRVVVFDAELDRRSRTRAAVGDRLEDAVRRDMFGLVLQPVMGGPGYGSVVGWEALARWNDPVLGSVPPDVFVPLAEQLGLIADLGEAVLRRACQDLARLRAGMDRDDLVVYVNVSPAQLLRTDFAAVVLDALEQAELPGRCLRLELTEGLLVDKGPLALDTLEELRAAGVNICLDDFGTGYASLLRLPIDCVKLDRSLIARLGLDAEAPQQVRAIIDLVHSLGITEVIAEGVETTEQEAALQDLRCPMVQGWLYGRPATAAATLAADVPAFS